MRLQLDRPDAIVARIAARQHGVLTYEQLLAGGLSQSAIQRRVAAGRLFRIHRGVYAGGHDGLSHHGRWKAATLALGDGAALSHLSAAALWRLLSPTDADPHVTVPDYNGRQRDGIVIHGSSTLSRAMTTARDNIPVTRPQRTLADIRAIVSPGLLRRAIREAEIQNLPIDAGALAPDRAFSGLELDFLAFCRRRRLPKPEVNVRVGRYRVDFLWPAEQLVVETDSQRFHRGLLAHHEDLERDQSLERRGFVVLRFTGDELSDRPKWVAAEIRRRLRAASPVEK
jgi:very-short-patch-repair endonuclease